MPTKMSKIIKTLKVNENVNEKRQPSIGVIRLHDSVLRKLSFKLVLNMSYANKKLYKYKQYEK